MAEHDDFYVGYQKVAPAALAAWVRRVIVGLAALAVAIPILLVAAQSRFSGAVFEWGTVRAFEGRLAATPYPVLHVDGTPHLLVEFGKSGAREGLAELEGHRARANGQLIYRGSNKMIELTADQVVSEADATTSATEPSSLGRHDLVGEILDSKCYLGVMKPGRGKPHRSCAVRCISGGVPPILIVTDERGNELHLLMVGEQGQPIASELLDLVAEPVGVSGEIIRRDGLHYLYADASAYSRLKNGESRF